MDDSLKQAVYHMYEHGVSFIFVVEKIFKPKFVGMLYLEDIREWERLKVIELAKKEKTKNLLKPNINHKKFKNLFV